MREPCYNTDLQGFIIAEKGIALSEWLEYAAACPELQRRKPARIRNPFKRDEVVTVPSSGFFFMVGNRKAGLLVWEEADCIGVAGCHPQLDAFVTRLCEAFNAKFEKV